MKESLTVHPAGNVPVITDYLEDVIADLQTLVWGTPKARVERWQLSVTGALHHLHTLSPAGSLISRRYRMARRRSVVLND
jgi:hypothetical protein